MTVQVHKLDAHLQKLQTELKHMVGQNSQEARKGFVPSQCCAYTRLHIHLFERSLSKEMTLYPGQSLMRVVVCLLNQTQLLTLRLIQP